MPSPARLVSADRSSTEAFQVDAGPSGTLTVLERGDRVRPSLFLLHLPVGYGPPVVQRHPQQTEHVRILSGVVDVRIDDVVRRCRAGDTLVVPAGAWHRTSNPGDAPVEMEIRMCPGMGIEEVMGRLFTAKQGKRGLQKGLAQLNVLVEYPDNVRFPPLVQGFFRALVWLGRALGVLGPVPEIASSPLPVRPDPHPRRSTACEPSSSAAWSPSAPARRRTATARRRTPATPTSPAPSASPTC